MVSYTYVAFVGVGVFIFLLVALFFFITRMKASSVDARRAEQLNEPHPHIMQQQQQPMVVTAVVLENGNALPTNAPYGAAGSSYPTHPLYPPLGESDPRRNGNASAEYVDYGEASYIACPPRSSSTTSVDMLGAVPKNGDKGSKG